MKRNSLILAPLVWALLLGFTHSASADMFGGGNAFEIEFVEIGNPGNEPDTLGSPNPAGSVAYHYRIGKYEISEQMIDKANALGGLGLTHDSHGPNKPATAISWFEAAQFVNWLNLDAGAPPAYKFDSEGVFQLWEEGDAGYDPTSYRNRLAKYFLPDVHEWYKAAYYDPVNEVYYEYPTGSNDTPDGIDFIGDTEFDAVFNDGATPEAHQDVTDAGLLSPYGTMAQGGNVWEWEENNFFPLSEPTADIRHGNRGYRGGAANAGFNHLLSTIRFGVFAASDSPSQGFRVASTPEPSSLLLMVLACVGLLMRRSWDDKAFVGPVRDG